MRLIRRTSWGARYGRGPTNITPQNGGVAVHYVGGGRLTGAAHSKCATRVRGIEDHHVNGNGWDGIAYNYLACEHGYVFEGRGLGHRSAAQGTTSGNQNYYAVCALVGDGDKTLPAALLTALRDAIDYMRAHGAGSKVTGHRDHHATSCPGAPLYAWVRAGAPRPSSAPTTPQEDDDVPTYVSIDKTDASRREELHSGGWQQIYFDVNNSAGARTHHGDGDYPSLVHGGEKGSDFVGDISIRVAGLPAGSRGQIRAVEVAEKDDEWVSVEEYLPAVFVADDDNGTPVKLSVAGHVNPGNRLRVEATLSGLVDVPAPTVVEGAVRLQIWER